MPHPTCAVSMTTVCCSLHMVLFGDATMPVCPTSLPPEAMIVMLALQVKSVEGVLAEGDELDVMCLGRDGRGHVKVSRRALLERPGEDRQRRVLPMMGIAARS